MLFNLRLFIDLTFKVIFRHRAVFGPLTSRRVKRLIFWYTVMPLHHLITWICFLLDNLFFPAYRHQKVEKPIFILSNFRSGSTLLHRLLAQDEETFTATRTWEIYLAPSILQRVIIRGVARFDRKLLGGWLNRKMERLDYNVLGRLPMHRMGLHLVDEDEGWFIHNWTSIFLVFVFPDIHSFKPYFYFDTQLNPRQKHQAMRFYQACIKRHVYFHGGKRYVAKSPAFSVKLETLLEYFPEARFIYLARNPVDMVASKTNYFAFCWQYFNDLEPYPFRDFLLNFTRHWYLYPLTVFERLPKEQYLVFKYGQLTQNLDAVVHDIYEQFDLQITPSFASTLKGAVESANQYVSKHRYSLAEMDYSPELVYENYREIFEQFGFSLNGKAMVGEPVADALMDVE